MTDFCTDGLLLRALEALEAAVLACGRPVSGNRQKRYLTWLVRDALGVQKAVGDAVAFSTGDRLVKAAKKVRVADLARAPAARAEALLQRYPALGLPPLPWDAPEPEPPPQAPPPQEPPPPPPPPPPPFDPAVYITDYEPPRRPDARSDAMLEFLREYFKRNDVDYQEPWCYWAPMILASAVADAQLAQSEAATWEEMYNRHSKMWEGNT